MASRRHRPLKLKVPWSEEPLRVCSDRVSDAYLEAIEQIKQSGSPYVREDENDVLVMNFFGVSNRVSDVSRYRIGSDRKPVPHCDISELHQLHQLRQYGSIVLLLESPHKYEYQPGNINCPIAPANGTTGENIHRCLSTVLSGIRAKHIEVRPSESELLLRGRHVIISNPIQYQTSLHAIHGQSVQDSPWDTLRNNVWKTLWNDEDGHVKQCFLGRLNTYNPSLIINACTGALTPNDDLNRTDDRPLPQGLKSLVTQFIRTELPTVPLYEAYHPADASWKSCDGIHLQRIYPQPTITWEIHRDVQRHA